MTAVPGTAALLPRNGRGRCWWDVPLICLCRGAGAAAALPDARRAGLEMPLMAMTWVSWEFGRRNGRSATGDCLS